ncbi:General stress protein 69 [Paenibacillus sp. P1XP2]|nr:General stress protein 69 [Paenibacillus sp. P1XP2]
MDAYLAIGGNSVDSAHIYCGGESEEVLGRYMKERGNRDQIVILTKGAHHDQNGPRVNKEAIRHDITTSLKRLQTDFIDLYALHRDDPNVPAGEVIEILNEYVKSGTVGAIGCSNWTWQRIKEANDYAAEKGLTGFTFSSPNLSLAKPNEPFWKAASRPMPKPAPGMKPSSFRSSPGLPRQEASLPAGLRRKSATTPTWSACSTATPTGSAWSVRSSSARSAA